MGHVSQLEQSKLEMADVITIWILTVRIVIISGIFFIEFDDNNLTWSAIKKLFYIWVAIY